jgi:hypothetical protein
MCCIWSGIFTLKDLREAYDTLQDIKAKDPNDPTIFFYKAFSSQVRSYV